MINIVVHTHPGCDNALAGGDNRPTNQSSMHIILSCNLIPHANKSTNLTNICPPPHLSCFPKTPLLSRKSFSRTSESLRVVALVVVLAPSWTPLLAIMNTSGGAPTASRLRSSSCRRKTQTQRAAPQPTLGRTVERAQNPVQITAVRLFSLNL